MEEQFWKAIDLLVEKAPIIIERPKGTAHPRYPHMIYPLDYGYLAGTNAMDGSGIDVWQGSREEKRVDALIVTVDLLKNDSEIKLLIGCTEEEKQIALNTHNESEYMKGILVHRPVIESKK